MKRIAIFASGNGTNAENIIKYFKNRPTAKVVLLLSNNKDAKVLQRAKNLQVNTKYFTKNELYESDTLLKMLQKEADILVLAGFLWKIPVSFVEVFHNRIINIHPALLPKYGGKGMYGMRVHDAVKDNKEKETGITIHYVNEKYDEGSIIFQKKIPISEKDTAVDIAESIHKLEYQYFPQVISSLLCPENKEDMVFLDN
jgi:phosphoribosylglycinamide formyltransferase-1